MYQILFLIILNNTQHYTHSPSFPGNYLQLICQWRQIPSHFSCQYYEFTTGVSTSNTVIFLLLQVQHYFFRHVLLFSHITCTKLAVSPWCQSSNPDLQHAANMHFLQQPATNLNNPHLVHFAKLDEWDHQIVLQLPLAEPYTNDLKSSNGSTKDDKLGVCQQMTNVC